MSRLESLRNRSFLPILPSWILAWLTIFLVCLMKLVIWMLRTSSASQALSTQVAVTALQPAPDLDLDLPDFFFPFFFPLDFLPFLFPFFLLLLPFCLLCLPFCLLCLPFCLLLCLAFFTASRFRIRFPRHSLQHLHPLHLHQVFVLLIPLVGGSHDTHQQTTQEKEC